MKKTIANVPPRDRPISGSGSRIPEPCPIGLVEMLAFVTLLHVGPHNRGKVKE